MKPAPFEYFAPTTVDEVVGLLHQRGDDAKVLAGGQSLVPMLNLRLARFDAPGRHRRGRRARRDRADQRHVVVGAIVRQREVEASDVSPPTCRCWPPPRR